MSITLVLLTLLAVGFVGYLLYPKLQARLADQASPVQTVGSFQRGLSALGGQTAETTIPPGARPVLRPPSVHDGAPFETPTRPPARPTATPLAVPPAPSGAAARRRQNVLMTLGMFTVFFACAGFLSAPLWAIAAVCAATLLVFAYLAHQMAEMEARRHEARKVAARREARRRLTETTASTTANMPAVVDLAEVPSADSSDDRGAYRQSSGRSRQGSARRSSDGVVEFGRPRRTNTGPARHSVSDIARRRAAAGS